jgi:hypothetical protein
LAQYNENGQAKENEMDRACSKNGARRNAYRLLVRKPGREKLLAGPGCRWADNVKIDLIMKSGVVRTGLKWLRTGAGGGLL